MRLLLVAGIACLTACSSIQTEQAQLLLPALPPPARLELAGVPPQHELFELSPAAIQRIEKQLGRSGRSDRDRLKALRNWLTSDSGLSPVYDNSYTRTASETLHSRAGNCLSLAMLVGSVANHLGLVPVFRQPDLPWVWDQAGDIEMLTQHINLVVIPPDRSDRIIAYGDDDYLLVDFINTPSLRLVKSHSVTAAQVADYYYINRAAELLADGNIEAAYAYVYTAVKRSPEFIPAYSTLGVLLRRKGEATLSEQVYLAGLQRQPNNPNLLNNLLVLYQKTDQQQKTIELRQRLDQLELDNPYRLARQAENAWQNADYHKARQLFQQALSKADYIHDFHFGIAKTYWKLGKIELARSHLEKAKQKSLNSDARQRYVAKLARLAEYQP